MFMSLQAVELSGGQRQLGVLLPTECPRCHRSIVPRNVYSAMLDGRHMAQVVYRCPHTSCQELFLGTYAVVTQNNGTSVGNLIQTGPLNPAAGTFPETIGGLSPVFIEIFNQSAAAEAHDLDQIVGIGLRKALEFLVKDYVMSEHPGEEEKIRKMMLGPCIKEFVSDPNVKLCAERAAWLGNDETHYTRRWDTKDVQDLKRLVKLTVNWIDSALTTKRYVAEMESGKKPDGA